MVLSPAKTVEEYLAQLPPERRAVVAAVRRLVLEHLPAGYVESIDWGMICWGIPLARYPETYNGRPLGYVALAAQKSHCSLHLLSVYADSKQERELRAAFARAGKRLDMGRSCVRFRRLEDLELDAIGRIIASTPPEAWIARYEASRQASKSRRR